MLLYIIIYNLPVNWPFLVYWGKGGAFLATLIKKVDYLVAEILNIVIQIHNNSILIIWICFFVYYQNEKGTGEIYMMRDLLCYCTVKL